MERRFLSACLIAKDEGQYLLEWIAFHRVVGFEFFYIYDNDSTDDTREVLAPLERHGICARFDWPRSIYPDNPQVAAYRDVLARYGQETEWMAIMDADEFIVPLTSESVADTLRAHFAEAPSVLINWRVFGSSGQETNDRRLCIDRFRHASRDDYHSNTHVKAIVRPRAVEAAWIHNHDLSAGGPVLSNGMQFDTPREPRTRTAVYGHFQLNHYFCKSRPEFMTKRLKGLADAPLDWPNALRVVEMFEDADRNEIEDGSATRFLGQTIDEMRVLEKLT